MFSFFLQRLMVSTLLKKKYRRVHILRRIKRFKFYSIAPFISSDCSPLRWIYALAKDMINAKTVPCANRLSVDLRVNLFKISRFKQWNKIVHQKDLVLFCFVCFFLFFCFFLWYYIYMTWMTNKKLNKKHIQKQDSTFDVVNKRFPTNAAQDIYFKMYL